jgi:hypothetical protein
MLPRLAVSDRKLARAARDQFAEREFDSTRWQYDRPTREDKQRAVMAYRQARDPKGKDHFESWYLSCAVGERGKRGDADLYLGAKVRVGGAVRDILFHTLIVDGKNLGTSVDDLSEYRKSHGGRNPGDFEAQIQDLLNQKPAAPVKPLPPLPPEAQKLLKGDPYRKPGM